MMKAQISNIQRYSVNDGYGIRTIVFLMGCTMRCAWCQNPETISARPGLMFMPDLCTACGACTAVCPNGATICPDGRTGVERDRCKECFLCVKECYFGARKASSHEWSVEQVVKEVLKDEVFFRNSAGGLTLSGGEALMSSGFCREVLRRVHDEEGLHTAIETAGNVPYSAFAEVLPYTDLFLYDIKLLDEKAHKKWTGVSNKLILANLNRLLDSKAEIIVRIPLLAGINDGREFNAIADYVSTLSGVKELHILPYHTLGESKYNHLGMTYPLPEVKEENEEEVERCRRYALRRNLRVSVGGAGFASKKTD